MLTWGAAVVAVTLLPLFVSPWFLSTVRDALVMGILALSYDLLWGRAGILTLGHTTFLGLGAYGFAIATVQFAQTPAIGLICAVGCAAMVAAAASCICRRQAAFLCHHQSCRADRCTAACRELAVGHRR